jgi:ATP-dependent helicase/nuclease subunit A
MQGIIDCFFAEDNKKAVLIDYKTDFVLPGHEDIVQKRYALQLEMYAKAISEIYGYDVKEKYIYLFSLSKYLQI